MLTQRQLQLLQYIQNFVREHDVSPSFEEMRSALQAAVQVGHPSADLRGSRSGATSAGSPTVPARSRWSSRWPKARSAASWTPRRSSRPPTSCVAPSGATGPSSRPAPSRRRTSLPLFGRIAAGSPIEALADSNAVIEVPGVLLGQGEHYVLQVVGNSMIDAGIYDGDYAVIQRCDERRERRHRRGHGRGSRGDAQAHPAARRLDRARARQQRLRDPHLRPAPGQDPGPAGRADAPLLSGEQHIRHVGEHRHRARGQQLAGPAPASLTV